MEATHGFTAGDRLALLLPNNPENIELAYAWRFGAIICGEVIIAESVIQTGQ